MRGCGEGVRGKAIEQQRAQGSQPPAHIFMASLLLALLPPAALLLLAVAVLVAAHGATRSPRCRVRGQKAPDRSDREKPKDMHGSRGVGCSSGIFPLAQKAKVSRLVGALPVPISCECASRVARTGAPTTPPRPARSRRARVTHALATLNPLL